MRQTILRQHKTRQNAANIGNSFETITRSKSKTMSGARLTVSDVYTQA